VYLVPMEDLRVLRVHVPFASRKNFGTPLGSGQ
jgi:hypothetical protein